MTTFEVVIKLEPPDCDDKPCHCEGSDLIESIEPGFEVSPPEAGSSGMEHNYGKLRSSCMASNGSSLHCDTTDPAHVSENSEEPVAELAIEPGTSHRTFENVSVDTEGRTPRLSASSNILTANERMATSLTDASSNNQSNSDLIQPHASPDSLDGIESPVKTPASLSGLGPLNLISDVPVNIQACGYLARDLRGVLVFLPLSMEDRGSKEIVVENDRSTNVVEPMIVLPPDAELEDTLAKSSAAEDHLHRPPKNTYTDDANNNQAVISQVLNKSFSADNLTQPFIALRDPFNPPGDESEETVSLSGSQLSVVLNDSTVQSSNDEILPPEMFASENLDLPSVSDFAIIIDGVAHPAELLEQLSQSSVASDNSQKKAAKQPKPKQMKRKLSSESKYGPIKKSKHAKGSTTNVQCGDLTKANQPEEWMKPLRRLLSNRPPNLEEEKKYNCRFGNRPPYCSICAFFTHKAEGSDDPFDAVTEDYGAENPAESSVAANGVLLVCATCSVYVHASCYGVEDTRADSEWICRRCEDDSATKAICYLCCMRGGALKPTVNKRWCHVVCALVTPEVTFVDPLLKEPIDVGNAIETRKVLSCKYCHKWTNKKRSACIQCTIGNCRTSFHVTCGYHAGVNYQLPETRDDNPVGVKCTKKHSEPSRRESVHREELKPVDIGDLVVAKHKNGRYYTSSIVGLDRLVYYEVKFVNDGTFCTNLDASSVLSMKCDDENRPAVGAIVRVLWTDGDEYDCIYLGYNEDVMYKVKFEDMSSVSIRREGLWADGEALPKKVQAKLSKATEQKHSPAGPSPTTRHRKFNSRYNEYEFALSKKELGWLAKM